MKKDNNCEKNASELAGKIKDSFTLGDLKSLCFDLNSDPDLHIDYDDLEGEILSAKVISLIKFCKNRQYCNNLYTHLKRLRPKTFGEDGAINPVANTYFPQERKFSFDGEGILIGDRMELIADFGEILFGIENKKPPKITVEYAKINDITQKIKTLQDKPLPLAPLDRLWIVDLMEKLNRYQNKVKTVQGAIQYLFITPSPYYFYTAGNLKQSVEGIGRLIFYGLNDQSLQGGIFFDVFHKFPNFNGKIRLTREEVELVEYKIGWSRSMMGTGVGWDLPSLPREIILSKVIPSIVVTVFRNADYLKNNDKGYDLNKTLNFDSWKFDLA